MKTKTLIILTLVTVILGGLFVWLTYAPKQTPTLPASAPRLNTISENTVDEIVITASDQKIILIKKENIFELNGRRVDKETLVRLWESLKHISLTGPLATNPDNHARFDLDDEKSTTIAMSNNGSSILAIKIGKTTSDFRGTYLRAADSDDVYASSENIGILFPTDANQWYDKTIIAVDRTEVHQIQLSGTSQFTLTINGDPAQTSTPWILEERGKPSKQVLNVKLDSFFNSLNPFKGNAFLSEEDKATFTNEAKLLTISFNRKDNSLIDKLIFVAKNIDEPWVYAEKSGQYLSLYGYQYEALALDPSSW